VSRIEISLSSIRFAESIRIDYSQLYSLHLQVKGHSAQSLISWSVSLIVSDFTIKGSTVYLYKYIAQAAVSVDCNGLALFCDSPPLPVADLGFQQEGGRGGKISLSFFSFPSLFGLDHWPCPWLQSRRIVFVACNEFALLPSFPLRLPLPLKAGLLKSS